MAKTDQGVYDYACQAGATVTGPVAVPVWGACSVPECWRLVVRGVALDGRWALRGGAFVELAEGA